MTGDKVPKHPFPTFELFYFCLVSLAIILYANGLFRNFSKNFFGFPGDSLGTIWNFWWLKFAWSTGLPLRTHIYCAYPFGVDFLNGPFFYVSDLLGLILSSLTNEVSAYNVIKLISFPTSALAMYLLALYLTHNRLASGLVGLAYAFSPFHVIHSMSHFSNIQWMPLSILFLLKTLDRKGTKNAALFALFFGITFVDYAYYGYFIGLLVPIFLLVYLLNKEKRSSLLQSGLLKKAAIIFVVFLIIMFPLVYPLLKSYLNLNPRPSQTSTFAIPVREFSDLLIYAAKPLDYLMPSKYNPFLGWMIPDLGIGPLKGHRYTEHTLYLGWTLILLGGIALYCAFKKKGMLSQRKEDMRVVYLFFAVVIVAALLSGPPFIPLGHYEINYETRQVTAEHKLYLPQYFLYKVFPMFRVYARMGVVVQLALCVLAAFGLREVLSRTKGTKRKYLALSLATLIFVDYAEFPPFRITQIQEPPVYTWLAQQPGNFPIAEYPLGSGDDPYTTYEYLFYQRIHKKYLVNGASKGTPADKFRTSIIDISRPETINNLSRIGVRYILLHQYKYSKGNEYIPLDWLTTVPREKIFPPEYNNGSVPDLTAVKNSIVLIKDFGDTAVYAIRPTY